jgi:hypothetical protein
MMHIVVIALILLNPREEEIFVANRQHVSPYVRSLRIHRYGNYASLLSSSYVSNAHTELNIIIR